MTQSLAVCVPPSDPGRLLARQRRDVLSYQDIGRSVGANMFVPVVTPAWQNKAFSVASRDLESMPSVGFLDDRRPETWHFRSLRGTTEAIVLAPEYSVNCRQLVRHVQ